MGTINVYDVGTALCVVLCSRNIISRTQMLNNLFFCSQGHDFDNWNTQSVRPLQGHRRRRESHVDSVSFSATPAHTYDLR